MNSPSLAAPRRGLARNALHLGIGQVVTTVLTVVLSAAIARTLGAAEFGLLYLATSIANFAFVFVDWGHGPYVTREIARRPERSGDLMGTVLVVRVATTAIMCVLAVTVTWLLRYDARTQLAAGLLILAWLPQFLGLTFSWAFRGSERMEYDALLQVILKAATLALGVVALKMGGGVLGLMPAYAAAGTIALVVAFRLYKHLDLPPLRVSRGTARELIRDGAPMLAIAMAVAVQPYIDANLLYSLSPASVVGWYGAAWGIAGTLVAPAMILGSTMYPRLSRVAADPVEFRRTLRTSYRALLLVAGLGATGTYLFADFAVSVIYSKQKFGPAADILRAFTPALLLLYIDMMLGHAILAVDKGAQLAKAKVVAVIVTSGLELVLIPYCQTRFANGGVGIMLAMACGELVMIVAMTLLIRSMAVGSMAVDSVRALVAGGLTVAAVRLLPQVNPVFGIALCVVLFAVASAAVGLIGREDLAALRSAIRKDKGADAPVPLG